jgi:hypothetical protein
LYSIKKNVVSGENVLKIQPRVASGILTSESMEKDCKQSDEN